MSLSPSWSETNYWIIGHASSTSEDVYSSVSKGSVSGSSRISSCDFRTACPVLHGCSSLRQWVASSSEPSTGTFNAQLVNDFLITFVGNSAQESRIHCKIVFDGGAFKFPAAVSSWIPTVASHSLYFSVRDALNGLFQLTSGACMYLVQPTGTITRSILLDLRESVTLSSRWHSFESQANSLRLKEKAPRTDWSRYGLIRCPSIHLPKWLPPLYVWTLRLVPRILVSLL